MKRGALKRAADVYSPRHAEKALLQHRSTVGCKEYLTRQRYQDIAEYTRRY